MKIKFIDKEIWGDCWNPDAEKSDLYWFTVSYSKENSADYAIQIDKYKTTLLNWDREDRGSDHPLYKMLFEMAMFIEERRKW